MCGIAGVAGRHRDLATIGRAMADTLVHRGPDSDGVFVDDRAGVVLAFRRLAIIDLQPTGMQPMTSRSGRWTIIFNGEIYNHRDIRGTLIDAGSSFRGHSDTETLIEAIDRWGFEPAIQRTNGMFAVAAFDAGERRLFIARDRMGEKPVYWQTLPDGRVAFGSELRALRAVPGNTMTIDPASATALLRWSYIPHPATIYIGVRQLAPGALLEIDLRGDRPVVAERQWWSLGQTIEAAVGQRRATTIDDAAGELEPLLAESVAMRMESDVPLGCFLSGGIDSSLIALLAQRAGGGPLRTFTVGMPSLAFDESAHAARVARHLGAEHEIVELSLEDALATVPTLPALWDEPFADPSMLPTALLCRAARRHMTVCLGGDGGDELFAGYNRHALGASLWRRTRHLPAPVRALAARAALAARPATVDRFASAVGRLVPGHRRLPNVGDKVQKAGLLLRGGSSAWDSLAEVWPLDTLGPAPHRPYVPTLSAALNPIEEMMLADTSAVLPDQMLVKVDRASMAASLEVRVPFLDHRLLEWSWRQPIEIKTAGGVGKLVLRRLAERLLPDDIVNRPKMGFDPPLGDWLRAELRPWAADLLTAPRCVSEGWIDESAVRAAWTDHLAGTRNWEYRLWSVLMLEGWLAEHHPV